MVVAIGGSLTLLCNLIVSIAATGLLGVQYFISLNRIRGTICFNMSRCLQSARLFDWCYLKQLKCVLDEDGFHFVIVILEVCKYLFTPKKQTKFPSSLFRYRALSLPTFLYKNVLIWNMISYSSMRRGYAWISLKKEEEVHELHSAVPTDMLSMYSAVSTDMLVLYVYIQQYQPTC